MSILIKEKKPLTLKDSFNKKILIFNDQQNIIGSLVPVGIWLLNDMRMLNKIAEWRRKFNQFFPTRKLINKETTYNFIKQSYIDNPSAILFFIYTKNKELVGHIGLSKLNRKLFELVNLIRGATGGDNQLIYFAEIAALNIGFKTGIKSGCLIELISYNWIVKDLHERVGFTKVVTYSLKKIVTPDSITHKKVSKKERNVLYTIDKYNISKKKFYSLNKFYAKI
jgi:hypothetical protein